MPKRSVQTPRSPWRRRVSRLRESGNLGWSVAALIISLIALAPVIAVGVLALKSSGDTWPHLVANVLPGALRRTLGLMAGVGLLTLAIGTGTAWLVTMYRFPGPAPVRMAAAPAARDPDLYHRLLLSRAVRLFRRAADLVAEPVRLAQRPRLLVPRHQESRRRHLRHERGTLPLRLHHRAGELPRPVGLRA